MTADAFRIEPATALVLSLLAALVVLSSALGTFSLDSQWTGGDRAAEPAPRSAPQRVTPPTDPRIRHGLGITPRPAIAEYNENH